MSKITVNFEMELKFNSKEADRYVTLKGGGVLCANQIGKKEDYWSKG